MRARKDRSRFALVAAQINHGDRASVLNGAKLSRFVICSLNACQKLSILAMATWRLSPTDGQQEKLKFVIRRSAQEAPNAAVAEAQRKHAAYND